jgi:hypothetical protein
LLSVEEQLDEEVPVVALVVVVVVVEDEFDVAVPVSVPSPLSLVPPEPVTEPESVDVAEVELTPPPSESSPQAIWLISDSERAQRSP